MPTNRPTKDQIYSLLFNWIKDTTGLTVIKANQKGPRPARPYASLNFINPSDALGDVQWSINGDKTVSSEGMYKAVASINVFGENAVDTLAKLRNSLDRPDVVELFAAANVTHLDSGQVNDLTALQETAYEERGQLDLTVAFVDGSEVDVGTIEHVELDATVGVRTFHVNVN